MASTNKKRVNSATVPYSFQKESMRNIITFVSVLITLQVVHYESAEGVLLEKPKDVTVIVNQSTFFNCSKSNNNQNEPIWYHHTLMGVRQDVYDNQRIRDRYKDRFSIDKNLNSGTFNLLVQRPETIDAGKYECVEDVEADTGSSAELTLLDSNLVCESDKDLNEVVGPTECAKHIAPDQLQLSCSVTYTGNFPPRMQWRKDGNGVQLIDTKCDDRDNRVVCTTTQEVNSIMDGSVYICQITTAPQYNCSLKVHKTIYAFPDTSEKELCSVNTSIGLPCSYKWFKDGKMEHSDQTFKPNNPGTYRCEVQCKIRNETCAFTTKIVYASEAETNVTGLIAAIIILSLLLTATMLILLHAAVLSRRNRRNGCNGRKRVKKPKAGFLIECENEVPLVGETSAGNANKVPLLKKTSAENTNKETLVGNTSAEDASKGPQLGKTSPEDASKGPQLGKTSPEDASKGPQLGKTSPEDASKGPQLGKTSPEDASKGPQLGKTSPDASKGPQLGKTSPASNETGLNRS